MQISVDMNQMVQEQMTVLQMCAEHEACVDCPMKQNGFVQTQISKWSCENASKV